MFISFKPVVVKSISRKDRNFAKAVRYVAREGEGDGRDLLYPFEEWEESLTNKEIIEKFEGNAEECPRRKNGVYFYHDVISFSHLDRERLTPEIMEDLALKYIESRAGRALVWGRIHTDTKCPHIHLIISANALGKSKKIRLSKKEFGEVKKNLEVYQRREYPFLEHSIVFAQEKRRKRGVKATRHEREREKRLEKESEKTGAIGKRKISEKEEVREIVHDCLISSFSEEEFKEKLKSAGLEFYQRGKKTFGVRRLDDNGKYRKFRLKTLGLGELYEKTAVYWRNRPEMEREIEDIETDRLRRLVAEMGFKRDVSDLLEFGKSDIRKEFLKALMASRELERERIMARELGEA